MLFLYLVGFSQTWVQKQHCPDFGSAGQAACFAIGDSLYIVGGQTSSTYLNNAYGYNVQSNTWFRIADFAGTARIYNVGFTLNGKGYVFGGQDMNSTLNELWQYDPQTNTWTQKTSLPALARASLAAFVINNKAYICGGANVFGVALNDVWEYDPVTDGWTQKANMGGPVRAWHQAFAINGKGYAGGGGNYSALLNDWWEYDPGNNTWIAKTSLPGYGSYTIGTSVSINGYGYLGIGNWDNLIPQKFFRYDPNNDLWTAMPDFPGTGKYEAYNTVCNNKCYVIGGNTGLARDSLTWQFTPSPIGLEELTPGINLHVYPTQVSESFTVHITPQQGQADQNALIQLLDVTGRVIREIPVRLISQELLIPRGDLAAGVLFVSLKTTTTTYNCGKVILQ